jgi:hypothetical protein
MEQNRGFTIGGWVSDGKRIGKGAFATVYLGHHKDDPSVRPSLHTNLIFLLFIDFIF